MASKLTLVLVLSLLIIISPSSPFPLRPILGLLKPLIRFALKELGKVLEEISSHEISNVLDNILPLAPSSSSSDINQLVAEGESTYHMHFSLGDPPQPMSAIMDTASDIIWTQCQPCQQCLPQSTYIYDPSMSDTFSSVSCTSSDCNYNASYINGAFSELSTTQGYFANETFYFGSFEISGVLFGCGTSNRGNYDNTSGVIGLGKGNLSLISQLNLTLFSYCFPLDPSQPGHIFFRDQVTENLTQFISTPFVNNSAYPTLYYLNLNGISVGTTMLDIPSDAFAFQADGTGGFVIATGITLTYLEQQAYQAVKEAFITQLAPLQPANPPVGLDLCFQTNDINQTNWPSLTFHFEAADMVLTSINTIILSGEVQCLAIQNSTVATSFLGNWMQAGVNMIYDIANSNLLFDTSGCINVDIL